MGKRIQAEAKATKAAKAIHKPDLAEKRHARHLLDAFIERGQLQRQGERRV